MTFSLQFSRLGLVACLLFVSELSLAEALKVKPVLNSNPERVLFVGNSYYYYNNSLHNHVSDLVKASDAALGARLQFKSSTIGGAALNHHNMAHLTEPGRIGVTQPFQWVVMQGGSAEPLSQSRREIFRQTAMTHAEMVKARGGQVALYMTHAYVKPHRLASPQNITATESMYVEVANEIGALVIPVGLAFREAYQRFPNLKLHLPDGTHPSLLGTYLAACTTYATLYGRSPVGVKYNKLDPSYLSHGASAIDEATATQLQQVAQDVVTEFFQRK
jgi:hypothetical protein